MMDQRKPGGHGKQRVLNVTIQDKQRLYQAYMPQIRNGALFVPLRNSDPIADKYRLGEELFLAVFFEDENEKVPVVGKVVWITPRGAQGNRPPGLGIQLSDKDKGVVRAKIENRLAGALESDRPTHTM